MSRRERNTPEAVIDNDRTVRGIPDEALRVERVIAMAARKARFEARLRSLAVSLIIGGAVAGYIALVLELWRR